MQCGKGCQTVSEAIQNAAADSTDSVFCVSTLPGRIPDVQRSRSLCASYQPLPVIPPGQPGFLPQLVPGTITGTPIRLGLQGGGGRGGVIALVC